MTGTAKQVLVHSAVQVESLHNHNVGIVMTDMGRVALLPEELPSAKEGSRVLELPPNDVGPLIELEGQVAMALDPVREGGVHDGFRGGTDGDGLGELSVTGPGHPRNLGGESLDVILLLLETVLTNE